ncbi:MAG: UDP-N-acetylmuramoyl-L-alanyl-D-glutamate--2,6-diaminopimelate ligase [Candidatus Komeilibacteria bacterium]|nr:UDP-N-acetylmuramoyl-L-alanyl-D-glutamate--2,6-diaminopimelate ligase [Candidatus Komeilibacteria bacterium]
MLKKLVKKILGKKLLLTYHLSLAKLAALYYGHPADKLIVIGVTGTNGKTTVVNFVSQYLDSLNQKNGLASTVNFKVADQKWLNDKKMTMLGRFQTQRLLSDMVKAGCKYAVIETSSQGIEQFRHIGINYDLVIFTNLTPEHIEAHGSFENYRAYKEKLFKHLSNSKQKVLDNKKIPKIIVSNNDDLETERLKKYKVDKFVTYSIDNNSDYQAQDIKLEEGVAFSLKNNKIATNFIGRFNVYNILAALVAVKELGFGLEKLTKAKLIGIPGRQEWIDEGQEFKVLVDYAPEPESLGQLYKTLTTINKSRLIHVIGSCGGGRDKARQPIMGKLAGQKADIVIVTNEDPYDDDINEIIDNVSSGAVEVGKIEDKDLFKIESRTQAIARAIGLAQTNDIVLITGKGAEQFICGPNGQMIAHDDRQVARDVLKK